jgi:hypothetical protein
MEAIEDRLPELLAGQCWDELQTFLSQNNPTDLADLFLALDLYPPGHRSGHGLSSLYFHDGGCTGGLCVLPDCRADSFSVRKPATTSRA